jgi:hypothetical protein
VNIVCRFYTVFHQTHDYSRVQLHIILVCPHIPVAGGTPYDFITKSGLYPFRGPGMPQAMKDNAYPFALSGNERQCLSFRPYRLESCHHKGFRRVHNNAPLSCLSAFDKMAAHSW